MGSDKGGKEGAVERGGDEGEASKEITHLTAVYPALFFFFKVIFRCYKQPPKEVPSVCSSVCPS